MELKPCPFCGSKNVRSDYGAGLQATCFDCGAEGPRVDEYCYKDAVRESTKAWNQRTEQENDIA